MHCAEIRDLVYPFLDGELEVDRNVKLLKHLELCPACRERFDVEGQLRDKVQEAVHEPLDEVSRRRLMASALDRAERDELHEAAREHTAPMLRLVRRAFGTAAVVLIGFGSWFVTADPACLFSCNANDHLLASAQELTTSQPLTLSAVSERLSYELNPPEGLVGPEILGAHVVTDADGRPARPLFHYRLPGGGEVCFVEIPSGHLHGRTERLPDGRDYHFVERDGFRFVGWIDARGQLAGCVPSPGLSDEELIRVAQAFRESRG